MKILLNPICQVVCLIIAAIVFNLLPVLITGIPLELQILSDVESHIAIWQVFANPAVFAKDHILLAGINTLPAGQVWGNSFLVSFSKLIGMDIFKFSIFLSFCSLALFLCGLYWLVYYSIQDKLSAFLITFFSIFGIHALGGSVFGVQALGFLPRDLALAVAMFLLLFYFHAIKRQSLNLMRLMFFITGLCANFYPIIFFQLILTLVCAETLRTRKISKHLICYFMMFVVGAFPAFIDILYKTSHSTPIDLEIMRSFYKYMIVDLSWDTVRQYLRRFIIYSVLSVTVYIITFFRATEFEKKQLNPWIALCIVSFILTVIGMYIESSTVFTKYMMSRISLWFILAAMVIISYGIRVFLKHLFKREAILLTAITASLIFFVQSNIPTAYRFLKGTYAKRDQTIALHKAISKLKELTVVDDLIIAPSSEYYDLAATVRTYSERSIYTCYKYGGNSVMDGALAREWQKKYLKLDWVFKNKTPEALMEFMTVEKIGYAFVPADYDDGKYQRLKNHIIWNTGKFLILRS